MFRGRDGAVRMPAATVKSEIGPANERARHPRVSICIPIYQGERFLARTLDSALAQDFEDFEIIALDNGSTDRTAELLDAYEDPRLVKLRSDTVVDLPTNWSRVVEASAAPYVKLLCADDLIHRTALRKQVEILDQRPEVSLVASRRALIDDRGRVLASNLGLRGLTGHRSGRDVARRTLHIGGINPVGEPAAVMFRRADFDEIGGWNTSLLFPMDLDLWLRLLDCGSFYGQSEELAAFRVSDTALSAAHSKKQYGEVKTLLDSIAARPEMGIHRSDRAISALTRRMAWEAWPLRQRTMSAGDVWQW